MNGELLNPLKGSTEQPAQTQGLVIRERPVPSSPLPEDVCKGLTLGGLFNEEEQVFFLTLEEVVQQKGASEPLHLCCQKMELCTGLGKILKQISRKRVQVDGSVLHQVIGLRQAEDLLVAHAVEDLESPRHALAKAQVRLEGDRNQQGRPPDGE